VLVVKRALLLAALAACGTRTAPEPEAAPPSPVKHTFTWQLERSELHPPDVSIVVDGEPVRLGRVSEDAEGDSCTARGTRLLCGSDRGYDAFDLSLQAGYLVVTRTAGAVSEGDGPMEEPPVKVEAIGTTAQTIELTPFDGEHEQTLRTALKLMCRAPEEVASDARGQARETAIAKLVDARVTNAEARQLWARLGTLAGDDKRRTLAEALHRVDLVQCPYLAQLPPSPPGPVRIRCDAEILLHCPPGYEDGCGGDRTNVHACVHVGDKAGAPCGTEVVMKCPAGERSSCFMKPPTGTKHICVRED
jgi:hypothetical protein